jgi:hypothetical protein
MRSFTLTLVLAATIMMPAAARAGWLVEGSLGKGAQVSPSVHQEQMTLMVAPGWSTPGISILRLQLGFLWNAPDVDNSENNFELRPMLTLKAPVLPLYGRVIVAINNLAGRDGMEREYAFGAAGGLRFGLGPIGIFAEAGVLPRSRQYIKTGTVETEKKFAWILEGRAGAYLEF